jgi:disulfide bond formation protein DsbB
LRRRSAAGEAGAQPVQFPQVIAAEARGGCVATGRLDVSGDLWEQLGSRMAVASCDTAPFHVLGLSMAGWNAIASIILAGASFFAATRPMRTDTANEPVQVGPEGMGADA